MISVYVMYVLFGSHEFTLNVYYIMCYPISLRMNTIGNTNATFFSEKILHENSQLIHYGNADL